MKNFCFYPNEFPKTGEEVLVKIISNDDNIINVELIEYNKMGLLIIKESNRKAYKKLKPLIILNKEVIVNVSEVNNDNITLFLNCTVSQDMNKFNDHKKIISLIENYSYIVQQPFIDLWKSIIYPLFDFNEVTTELLLNKAIQNFFCPEMNKLIIKKFGEIPKNNSYYFKLINPNKNGILEIKTKLINFQNSNENVEIKLEKTPEYKIIISGTNEKNHKNILDSLCKQFNENFIFEFINLTN
jgi:translation initiation factor 2 alpha subunit (eIF-2alpha)